MIGWQHRKNAGTVSFEFEFVLKPVTLRVLLQIADGTVVTPNPGHDQTS